MMNKNNWLCTYLVTALLLYYLAFSPHIVSTCNFIEGIDMTNQKHWRIETWHEASLIYFGQNLLLWDQNISASLHKLPENVNGRKNSADLLATWQ